MTEKSCETEKKECKCIIGCECFKKFLIVTFGSFIGVFFALSLFAALHMPPCPCKGGCPIFNKDGAKFEKQVPPHFDKKGPEGVHAPFKK